MPQLVAPADESGSLLWPIMSRQILENCSTPLYRYVKIGIILRQFHSNLVLYSLNTESRVKMVLVSFVIH